MRFVWAVAAFVLAAVMIASGVAQRTVFQGPKTETTAIDVSGSAAYTLIDGAVLDRLPGSQTLRAAADGTVFAAYGPTADMKAWLSDTDYNHVTLGSNGDVKTGLVAPKPPADGDAAEPAHRDPAGVDLWLDEFEQDDILIEHLQLPQTVSVLVATDGTDPAPADLSVTWSIERSTPWAGPLIVGGGILMLVGVFLYILGIRKMRRSRGPRRKSPPPLPETAPVDLSVEESDKGVISAGAPAKAPARRRRAFVAVPVVLAGALAVSGCSADAWPQFATSPSPTPTETVVDAEDAQAPAVTATQADRILGRISTAVAKADDKKDAKLAATRLTGAPLAERKTNYTLRKKIDDQPAMDALPATGLKVVLPQAYNGWPRTVLLVADEKSGKDDTVDSTLMMMTQSDPWSNYKVAYTGRLEAESLPDVAPAYLGAAAVQPDSSFLVMPPADIAAAYADVMDNGDKSEFAAQFATDGDPFLKGVTESRKKQLKEFDKTAKKTGKMKFASKAGAEDPLALATLESGAIVAVNVDETETVTPTDDDAVIKLPDNDQVEALTGVKESQSGFTTTYSDQLFFYVPGVGSADAQIQLLGYSSNILGAKVVSK